jgi:hypothetical protein
MWIRWFFFLKGSNAFTLVLAFRNSLVDERGHVSLKRKLKSKGIKFATTRGQAPFAGVGDGRPRLTWLDTS